MPTTKIEEYVLILRGGDGPWQERLDRIAAISHQSRTHLYVEGKFRGTMTMKRREAHIATTEELAEARAIIAERERQRQEKDQQAQESLREWQADPRYPYCQRFDQEAQPWHALTLAQLQQIAAWLDAAREG